MEPLPGKRIYHLKRENRPSSSVLSTVLIAQLDKNLHRFLAALPGHEQVIMIRARNHIAGDSRIGERGGNGGGETDAFKVGIHLQRDLGEQRPTIGGGRGYDLRDTLLFPHNTKPSPKEPHPSEEKSPK